MKKTGPTNTHLRLLISELKKNKQAKLWSRIAKELERSSRMRRKVNLFRINKITKTGETAVIPGKVLSVGDLDKKITIAAYEFSKAAETKIKNSGSKAISLQELLKSNAKASKCRIVG